MANFYYYIFYTLNLLNQTLININFDKTITVKSLIKNAFHIIIFLIYTKYMYIKNSIISNLIIMNIIVLCISYTFIVFQLTLNNFITKLNEKYLSINTSKVGY